MQHSSPSLREQLKRNALKAARRVFIEAMRPDPVFALSEWADRRMQLSAKSGPEPGPFRTSRTPYLREPMDCLSPSSPVEYVTMEFARQLGKTTVGLMWWASTVDGRPGTFIYTNSTKEQAKKFSSTKVDPTIESTPWLRAKVTDRQNKENASSTLEKQYPGGLLTMFGAQSKDALTSISSGTLYMDEVDRYPADVEGEGDPMEILINAANTYPRRKILITSTPTIRDRSNVETWFKAGDQSRFHVPCPLCEQYQVLELSGDDHGLIWEGAEPQEAHYKCVHCKGLIPEYRKTWMLERGRWIAQHPERSTRHRSFQLSALYAPLGWISWATIANRFLKASKKGSSALRAFVNTVLGETYLERGDRPDWEPLMDRREEYRSGTVPAGVLVLTAGVDVQKDRLEYSIYGWGRKGQHWLIEHTVLTGAPVERAVWRELDNSLITRTFRSDALKADLPVRRIAVDAGYEASFVYRWARLHPSDRVLVIHGKQKLPMAIGAPKTVDFNLQGKRVYRGSRYYPVGTDFLKGALYGTLRLEWRKGEPFPDGFLHFPTDAPEEYFKGLTAEQLVTSETKSREVHYEWVKLAGRRNEPMDCYGYARAMAVSVGVDRWNDEAWDALEHELRDSGLANRQPAAKTRRRPYEGYLDDRRP